MFTLLGHISSEVQTDVPSKLSRLVSLLVNPLVIPTFIFWCVGDSLGLSFTQQLKVSGASLGIYFIAPLSYVVWLVQKGQIETWEARIHESRKRPLLLGTLMLILGIPLMAMAWPSDSSLGGLIATIFAINGLILATITLRFKISLHVSTVTSVASIIGALYLSAFIPFVPWGAYFFVLCGTLVLLVGWARIHQKAHSRSEVVWGALYGLVVPFVQITLLGFWLNQ